MSKTIHTILLLGAAAANSFAQGGPEKPITFFTVIDTPGSYILTRDLSTFGPTPALTIRASNVIVNLGGFQISGSGSNSGTGILIDGASGVQVRNGYVRDLGFGVMVTNASSVTLSDLHIAGRGLAVSAPPPEVGIMIVNSKAVTVRHNSIYNVGLGVFVRGPQSMGNHIYENTISAGTNGLLGVCYNPAPGPAGGPSGDTVERNAISGFRIAIQASAGGPNVFRDNTLLYRVQAFEISAGVTVIDTGNTKVQLP